MYYHQHSPNINATLLVSQRKTSRYLLFNDDNLLCGWVNKDTMETKPAGFRYREGEYQEYAYSGIQVTTPKIYISFPKENIPLSISISPYVTGSTSSAM